MQKQTLKPKEKSLSSKVFLDAIDELKKTVATKKDLKKELQSYATKKDLELALQQVVQDISDLQNAKWEEANLKFDRLAIGQDKIMGMLENWEIENTVGTEQIRELRVEVDGR